MRSGSRQLEVSAPTCVATAALRGVAAVVVAQARARSTIAATATATMAIRTATGGS